MPSAQWLLLRGGGSSEEGPIFNFDQLVFNNPSNTNQGQLTSTYNIQGNPLALENTSSDVAFLVRAEIVDGDGSPENIAGVGVSYTDFNANVDAMVIRPGETKNVLASFRATRVTAFTVSGAGNPTWYNGVYNVQSVGPSRQNFSAPIAGIGAYYNDSEGRWGFGVFVEDGPYAAYMPDEAGAPITPINLDYILATSPPMIGEMYPPYNGILPGPSFSNIVGPTSGNALGNFKIKCQIIALYESDLDSYVLNNFDEPEVGQVAFWREEKTVKLSEGFDISAVIYTT